MPTILVMSLILISCTSLTLRAETYFFAEMSASSYAYNFHHNIICFRHVLIADGVKVLSRFSFTVTVCHCLIC